MTKQNILLILFSVLGLIACNNSDRHTKTKKQTAAVASLKGEQLPKNDSIVYDENVLPTENSFSVKVLTVGIFHNDEVDADASHLNWLGLFNDAEGYYLKQTKITAENVNDAVVDENENEKTGWEIQTEVKDSCLILIEALPYLTERKIKSMTLSKNIIYPDETLKFQYSGVEYKLFATGGKKKTDAESEWFEVWNYKLYLSATIDGQERKSLLVAQPYFDDQMTELIFAGDLDGDGILDLIINTSNHYNVTRPTIYLSKPVDNGEIVKPIGAHTSVGC